ncbi:dihydrofolate reductase family protein [Winogradskya humida]|uniref:DNA-binding protein n=1 Tax=Winogradskya humida TaxID=113566 RepID=A0ABQ3ZF63_9ACTN|nr:dihydrofolate reductase family protein [Actinoplanes humidus]GIE17153.1 DNA-binding protein [Actinoplanes humidus]
MAKVVADISVSLDGFVTGPGVDLEHGLGRGGEALHTWALNGDAVDREIRDATTDATGAVVMGRTLFDFIDGPNGWTEEMGYGADRAATPPVLVVTRNPPASVRLGDRFSFIPDGIAGAVAAAAAIADDRDVVIMGGARTVRGALDAGVVDELRLHLSPVILGAGTPLFAPGTIPRTLRQIHVRPSTTATHLTYRLD